MNRPSKFNTFKFENSPVGTYLMGPRIFKLDRFHCILTGGLSKENMQNPFWRTGGKIHTDGVAKYFCFGKFNKKSISQIGFGSGPGDFASG